MPDIGRRWTPKTSVNHLYINVLSTGVPVQLLPFNRRRKAIILSASTGSTYTVSWDRTLQNGQGMQFSTGQNLVVLTDEDLGDVVTLPLFAVASTQNRIVYVAEILYDEVTGNLFDAQDETQPTELDQEGEGEQPAKKRRRGIASKINQPTITE